MGAVVAPDLEVEVFKVDTFYVYYVINRFSLVGPFRQHSRLLIEVSHILVIALVKVVVIYQRDRLLVILVVVIILG